MCPAPLARFVSRIDRAACANKFVQDWAQSHGQKLGDACAAPEWYRQDETVPKIIAEQGKLGTGK